MYNFMKKGAMMLLIAGLAMSVTNCSDDDPNYDNVTPPEVAIAPNTLTGVITSINGSAISNATVTLGTEKATSDANGVYLFADVKPGTYTIKAEADGKQAKEAEITVDDSKESQNWCGTPALPQMSRKKWLYLQPKRLKAMWRQKP